MNQGQVLFDALKKDPQAGLNEILEFLENSEPLVELATNLMGQFKDKKVLNKTLTALFDLLGSELKPIDDVFNKVRVRYIKDSAKLLKELIADGVSEEAALRLIEMQAGRMRDFVQNLTKGNQAANVSASK